MSIPNWGSLTPKDWEFKASRISRQLGASSQAEPNSASTAGTAQVSRRRMGSMTER